MHLSRGSGSVVDLFECFSCDGFDYGAVLQDHLSNQTPFYLYSTEDSADLTDLIVPNGVADCLQPHDNISKGYCTTGPVNIYSSRDGHTFCSSTSSLC